MSIRGQRYERGGSMVDTLVASRNPTLRRLQVGTTGKIKVGWLDGGK